jgi:hypothetical protein
MVMLKGSTIYDLGRELLSMAAIALVTFALAINRYRKSV